MPKAKPGYMRNFLSPAETFYEVTRGRPYLLPAEALPEAGLTAETWRLEILPDDPPWRPTLERTYRNDDHTALTFSDLEGLFQARPIRYIKTMECLMDAPDKGYCSNGLWEGVALRDVLTRLGALKDVRRVFYSGYYDDPRYRFISSLSLSEILETPPGHLPVILAFRLNGRPLPIERGGPVRVVVPEAYGFKSIKWLNRIVLTNDYRANDTYAEKQNNDPQTPMKTLARLDVHAPSIYRYGEPMTLRGMAVVGASGLRRVEYWICPGPPGGQELEPGNPAWSQARWKEAELLGEPPADWDEGLPDGRFPDGVLGLDPETRCPKVWPLPFSWVPWQVRLEGCDSLEPGTYEFRVRAVDLNGFAQPEPRPNPQSGIADIPCMVLTVE